ncbi:DNA polymerase III subunit delta [Streptococcus moroccensis]|uniref:DNA polymerase III subunit delta n=1 Tax=Streptococcus moroccensis TaxID=1451356 RepID=A0ABT9YTE4_9STRE|nr:DNA polymerase III subunit delta [Streptococcus moroccensis]MDQ0223243.1 DNA polymerase-3 subunit delta [Streptococcus moroccensis]
MLAIERVEDISRENLPALTVLAGDDIGQFSQVKARLLEKLAYEPSDLSQAYFDVREANFDDVAMDLESLPFFSEEKLVILDHVLDLTTAKKRVLSDDQLERLENYLENPVETTKLILLIPGKLDGKRRMVKLLKRDALLIETNDPKEAELRAYFTRAVQKMGFAMEGSAFETLLAKSNFDFSQIQQNLALLKAYKGSGAISHHDIEMAIPKSLQDNIFDLTQLTLKGQMEPARQLAKDLSLQGEDEVKLIAIMVTQLRLYAQVKTLLDQGKTETQMVNILSDILGRKVNPYQVKYALRDSKNLPMLKVQKALKVLIETDYQIKTGVNDKSYLFEIALFKIAS